MAKTIETSLNMISTSQGGDKIQKAIVDINPNATSDKLVGFAQRLNALTTNDYGGAVKITKQELSTNKTAATLYVSQDVDLEPDKTEVNVPWTGCTPANDNFVQLYTNSDGKPFIVSQTAFVTTQFFWQRSADGTHWILLINQGSSDPYSDYMTDPRYYMDLPDGTRVLDGSDATKDGKGDIVVAIAESDTYTQSNTVTIHVTA